MHRSDPARFFMFCSTSIPNIRSSNQLDFV